MPTPEKPLPTTDRGLAAYIASVRPGPKRQWLALGNGLTLAIETSGAKTWQARFRLKGSKQAKRMVLGHYPAMTLTQARQRLAEVKSEAKMGGDPTLQHRRQEQGIGQISTVGQLVDAYLARRVGSVADKTFILEQSYLAMLRDHLGDHRLVDLERRDIARLVEDYARHVRSKRVGVAANRLLSTISRMFTMSQGWGLFEGNNPAKDLRRPVKEQPRNRVLVDGNLLQDPAQPNLNEIGLLAAALLDEPTVLAMDRKTRVAVMLSILLGLRASEVCALPWADVSLDGEQSTITIRKSKTDAGRRVLPLPPTALALLRDLRADADRTDPRGTMVFPAAGTAERREHLHPESLSRAVARAAERLKLEPFTHHDLRRTCITGLAELGHDGLAVRIAGHTSKTVTGRHYDHSRRMGPIRAALTEWDAAISAAVKRHRAELSRADISAARASNDVSDNQ